MTTNNEQISPAEFDLSPETAASANAPAADSNQHNVPRWVFPLLLLLVVIAGLVVFWLPGHIVQQPEVALPVAGPANSQPVAAGPRGKAAQEAASPWADAQTAKLRKQAQDVLTNLLEAQSSLEKIGVQQWAAEAFAKAAAIAEAGDDAYRERQFEAARKSYGQALVDLQALLDRAPQVVADNVTKARDAINADDAETANSALLIAATIEPDNAELPALRQRVQVMEPLFNLLAQAGAAEKSTDLKQAVGLLKQAVALDPQSDRARTEFARLSRAYTTQQFNDAMSQGYLALDKGQFEQARSAFRKAGRLQPGSSGAASALEEVDSAETAHRLAQLQDNGQALEAQEKWSAAAKAFEQALQIDSSLMIAQQGLQRARTRAKLDQQLQSAIDRPERLSEKAVANVTAQLLQRASAISPRGPLLQQQLQQLEVVLKKANTPVTVTLRSDMATEVTLRRVARLGRFQERVLSLRPGTYVAVGTRDGYRDVRRTFSVNHDSEPPAVVIACTEQI